MSNEAVRFWCGDPEQDRITHAGGLPSRSSRAQPAFAQWGFGAAAFTRFASEGWWARQDSNLQPDRYERQENSRSC
jgi:hypothetical protein